MENDCGGEWERAGLHALAMCASNRGLPEEKPRKKSHGNRPLITTTSYYNTNMHVNLEFSGGMELLFDNKSNLKVEIPDGVERLGDLLPFVRDNILTGDPSLFMDSNTMYIVDYICTS